MNVIVEMFSYSFLVRAFIVGLLVSLCASMLGVSLVLKRYSMIGDSLSNVGFGALAIAMALNAAPLAFSIPVVIVAAFLLMHLNENSLIKGDAALALVSTASLAIGVMVVSLTTGLNTDVCSYMFGSILVMSKADVYLSVTLSLIVIALFIFCYHQMFAITFDENFARATGVKVKWYKNLLAILTALTVAIGMRMMGALLISSLIIFPALTAMRLCRSFKWVMIHATIISVVCFFSGLVMSYVYATPTGASVVTANIIVFMIYWALSLIRHRTSRV